MLYRRHTQVYAAGLLSFCVAVCNFYWQLKWVTEVWKPSLFRGFWRGELLRRLITRSETFHQTITTMMKGLLDCLYITQMTSLRSIPAGCTAYDAYWGDLSCLSGILGLKKFQSALVQKREKTIKAKRSDKLCVCMRVCVCVCTRVHTSLEGRWTVLSKQGL